MLEGLAAWVIKTYVGKYVNVNPDKLSIGLLSGVVELENVQLNPEAFNEPEFPFEFKCGYAGKIKLNVSLNTLRYSPWVLDIDKLFILIGPKDLSKQETKSRRDQDHEHEYKQKADKLNDLEAKWFKEVELLGLDEETVESNKIDRKSKLWSLLSPMLYSLLNNIHVSLNNIHIRYEDTSNNFSLDTDIESIEIKNETKSAGAENNLTSKMLELKNFSIYSTNRILQNAMSDAEFHLKLYDLIKSDREDASSQFSYLIEPTSFQAQLVRDLSSKPLRKRKKPRIRLNTVLTDFNIHINHSQMNYFAHVVKFANVYKNALRCERIERPTTRFDKETNKKAAREWWLYLYECVRAQIRQPNMNDLVQWSRDVVVYRQAIEANLATIRYLQPYFSSNQPTSGVVSTSPSSNMQLALVASPDTDLSAHSVHLESSHEAERRRIETEWSYERLFTIRRAIFERFVSQPGYKAYLSKMQLNKPSSNNSNNNNLGVYGYLSWRLANFKDYYFGAATSKEEEPTPVPPTPPSGEHNKVDDEVLGLINDSLENDTLLRRDSLLAILEFKLNNCSISLATSQKKQIVRLRFEQSMLTFEALPRYNSFMFELNLNSFYLVDSGSLYTQFPNLIYPKLLASTADDHHHLDEHQSVFKIVYEHKPLVYNTANNLILTPIKQLKSMLAIKSSGLDIVFNRVTCEKLAGFMKDVNNVHQDVLTTRYADRIKFYRKSSLSSNRNNRMNAAKMSILHNMSFNFDITAPKIIFPQDLYKRNPNVVIFDFGRLVFANNNSNNDLTNLSNQLLLSHGATYTTSSFFLLNRQKLNLSHIKSTTNGDRRNSDSNMLTIRSSNPLMLRTNSTDRLKNAPILTAGESEEDVNEDDDEESGEDDDIFATPIATPPPELDESNQTTDGLNFYSNFTLKLNELQVLNGNWATDNLQSYLSKGHSSHHLLEKFDINIQIGVCKLIGDGQDADIMLPGEENESHPPVKVDICVNLLKVNLDDVKLINIYRTWVNLKHFMSAVLQNKPSNGVHHKILDNNQSNNESVNQETSTDLRSYLNVDLKLNEVDITMSLSRVNTQNLKKPNDMTLDELDEEDASESDDQNGDQEVDVFDTSRKPHHLDLKSLCELKLYSISSSIRLTQSSDLRFELSLHNMLLIDAHQIYGVDYQLLAASHSNIVLDSQTGLIKNSITGQQEDLTASAPLINITVEKRLNKIDCHAIFSNLDIILNPETIAEIVILVYSVYFNVSNESERFEESNQLDEEEQQALSDTSSSVSQNSTQTNIDFKFNRLSVLMFKIEDEDLGLARKIALFALNGVGITANILPGYYQIESKLDDLSISDLSKIQSNNFIFGLGLDDNRDTQQTPNLLELVYRKSTQFGHDSVKNEINELEIKIASMFYMHSPKLVHDLECCMKDFKRFHTRIMEDVTNKAAQLALDMIKKGQTYFKNTLAELYQHDEESSIHHTVKPTKPSSKLSSFKIKLLLETPVIAIPIKNNPADDQECLDYFVAHLGQIDIKNAAAATSGDSESRLKISNIPHDSTNFRIMLTNMNMFSINTKLEKELSKAVSSSSSHPNHFFQMFCHPNRQQNLVDKTDMDISVSYLPNFEHVDPRGHGKSKSRKHKLTGGCLSVSSKIVNVCKIHLSKSSLEQLSQTIDNIVYKEEVKENIEQPVKVPTDVNSLPTTPIRTTTDHQFRLHDISYKSTPARSISRPVDINYDASIHSFMANSMANASFLSSSSFSSYRFRADNDTTMSPSTSYLQNLSIIKPDDEGEEEPDSSSNTNVDILFKFDRFEIDFFADVDKPLKQIGTLCFNNYELSITRTEAHLSVLKMKLKSLFLTDCLNQQGDNKESYLLWSDSNKQFYTKRRQNSKSNEYYVCKYHTNVQIDDLAGEIASKMNGPDAATNLAMSRAKSFSHENLNLVHKMRNIHKRHQKHHHHQRHYNNDFLNNVFELTQFYGQLSTSLPSELCESFSLKKEKKRGKGEEMRRGKREERSKETTEVGDVAMTALQNAGLAACPSTPPPSPTIGKQRRLSFGYGKSESMSSVFNSQQENNYQYFSTIRSDDPVQMRNIHNKQKVQQREETIKKTKEKEQVPKIKKKKCLLCLSEELNPLVRINVLLVDQKHPEFESKYKKTNRFLNIKFSSLKLNVNPETWIILLDLLGLGSKVYPAANGGINDPSHNLFKTNKTEKPPASVITTPPPVNQSTTGIKFQVKQFTIQLNESESPNKHVAEFRVNQVKAFVRTKPDCLQVNGQLGRVEIYDTSPYAGLYTDRFMTSGRQALEFELFKYLGPLDHLYQTYDYDLSLKITMSSVKYVHTQRFISSISAYFQQFNQLQDALSKMRALSLGTIGNISMAAQRSSRVKLDVKTEAPIIVIPINNRIEQVLIFNLGKIEVQNKFELPDMAKNDLKEESDLDESSADIFANTSNSRRQKWGHSNSFSLNDTSIVYNDLDRDCLLDLIDIKFTDTHLYSAERFVIAPNEDSEDEEDDDEFSYNKSSQSEGEDSTGSTELVRFVSYGFRQCYDSILRQQSNVYFRAERNLENELSHKSPDWYLYSKFSEVFIRVNLEQYKLIRGILDKNLGEPVMNKNLIAAANFIIANAGLETVLTGRVWKSVSVRFDLENVGIELYKLDNSTQSSLAYLSLIKSSLTYEGFSDTSKLVDLVSNEIIMTDTRKMAGSKRNSFSNQSTETMNFYNVFSKKASPSDETTSNSQRLQLELHFRSNKKSQRYSVLFNSCRVITIVDWLIEMKNFLTSNIDETVMTQTSNTLPLALINQQPVKEELPIQVKFNLTNTDFIMIENLNSVASQAIILRLTAFFEYNPAKLDRPVESCLQSFELFSCQMNAIEETALSIIDPFMFNIFLRQKNQTDSTQSQTPSTIDYVLEMSTDVFRLRFSYLDFNLFLRVIESVKMQFELQSNKNASSKDQSLVKLNDTNTLNTSTTTSIKPTAMISVVEMSIWMTNFCLCIIDDCNDIDVPLIDIQFSRFNLLSNYQRSPSDMNETVGVAGLNRLFGPGGQGSAEFAVNIDFYNRLLSGWEPLLEPWLARLNWKLKPDKNVVTVTSMDVLNVNLTNPFIELITGVFSNWKRDFNTAPDSTLKAKRHTSFQPYKLINLTGQPIKFSILQNANSSSTTSSNYDSNTNLRSLEQANSVWITVEDKCERQFNFNSLIQSHADKSGPLKSKLGGSSTTNFAQRSHNNQLRKLVQNKIRIQLDDWSEIRPLSIDKVGTYYRDIYRLNQDNRVSTGGSSITRLIFDITLNQNAIKLIEIKSPVTIHNKLSHKLQCRIESANDQVNAQLGPLIVECDTDKEISVPIKYLPSNIWFRPIELTSASSDEVVDSMISPSSSASCSKEAEFNQTPLTFSHVNQPGQVEYVQLDCRIIKSSSQAENFQFFAKIRRHNFQMKKSSSGSYRTTQMLLSLPGHSISIEPAFTLYNLLPLEFRYKFASKSSKSSSMSSDDISGKIDGYKLENFANIDVARPVDFLIDLDNLHMQKSIEINPQKHLTNLAQSHGAQESSSSHSMNNSNGTASSLSSQQDTNTKSTASELSNRRLTVLRRINLLDENNRPLFLIARIIFKVGSFSSSQQLLDERRGSNTSNNSMLGYSSDSESQSTINFKPCPIILQVSAVYCFFNLTGLPLVFRQYNADETAGQGEEHEYASSNQPLLFSFNDVDSPYACSMRIGKQCKDFRHLIEEYEQTQRYPVFPKWCKPFGLDSGSSFRPLYVVNNIINQDADASVNNNSYYSETSQLNASASSDNINASLTSNTSSSSQTYLNPDWVYYIGIEIKNGKGLLKDTTFVYFSTRYYLVNKTNQDLLLSQFHFVRQAREQNVTNMMAWNYSSSLLNASGGRRTGSSSSLMSLESTNLDTVNRGLKDPTSGIKSRKDLENSTVLLKNSMSQFHWPRADFDQLLSVAVKRDDLIDESGNYNQSYLAYNWSGGFKIDTVDSFYVTLRSIYSTTEFYYVKVDVVLDGGTFYIIFSEKRDHPFPIRIENHSQVPLYAYQSQSLEEKYQMYLKPNGHVLNYSWAEPIGDKKLIVGVKGGTSTSFDNPNSSSAETTKYLFYENFIYIVFTDENNSSGLNTPDGDKILSNSAGGANSNFHLVHPELVLTCVNKRLYLDYKESGNRSQLWSLTPDGYLLHEGSSPPRELEMDTQLDLSSCYVLDIEEVAVRPGHFMPLTIRRPDMRRKNFQKWTFDHNGYLCCNVRNMCLQVPTGELRRMAKVMLGPINNPNIISESAKHPIKQVYRQQLRPGSGHLIIKTFCDGPTRVLKISNIKNKSYVSINWEKQTDEDTHSLASQSSVGGGGSSKSLELYVNLTGGIGLSLIHWSTNQDYEELIYAYLKSLEVAFDQTSLEQKLTLSIQSVQVCNQLMNATKQNLLCIQTGAVFNPAASSTNSSSGSSSGGQLVKSRNHNEYLLVTKKQTALEIEFLRKFRNLDGPVYIENLAVNLSDVNLQIEERLLWKLIQFFGIMSKAESQASELSGSSETKFSSLNTSMSQELNLSSSSSMIVNTYYKNQIQSIIADSQALKYSFNKLQVNAVSMSLSVYKTPKLSPDLQRIKSGLGIPLIQFENAKIECKPFILLNEHDTAACIANLISKHYTQELRSNAIRILGSVDFLGNPLGLMVDFKESLSNILSNGQVSDFVFSITHGVANSVSKFSGSLSDELNEFTMDERHRETREQIRNIYNNGSIDHFVGGMMGFAVGVVGGALSLATQTYRGFNENGVSGAFAGLGKGAVGTVSKPIVGVLDFATGIASAIRETSKTQSKMEVPRVRESRCCTTDASGTLLGTFSRADANGQKILYQVNGLNLTEKYIALEQLNNKPNEQSLALVTNERVIFIKSSEYEFRTAYEITYQQLKGTSVVEEKDLSYLEICIETDEGEKIFPRFKFENKEAAKSLDNKIRYAKALYDETFFVLLSYKDDDH